MAFFDRIKSFFGGRAQEGEPPVSIVLLLKRSRVVTQEQIEQAIQRAWKESCGEAEKAPEVVGFAAPTSVISAAGYMFLINNLSRPYFENTTEAAAAETELRKKKILEENAAWLSVDVIGLPANNSQATERVYRMLGQLAAEFVDEDCLGVYLPATEDVRPSDGMLLSDLRSGQPLECVPRWEHVPVVSAVSKDAQLEAATTEARRRWSEFTRAFESRKPQQMFSVKALFAEGEHVEHMWVDVTSIGEGEVRGTLGNSPVYLKNLREEDPVSVLTSEIEDWIVFDGEKVQGGFSLAVLAEKME